MAGSRGFLLVLLLATVTCIIVIQVSLDGWIRRGSLNFYQFAVSNQKEIKPDQHSVTTKTIIQTESISQVNKNELTTPRNVAASINTTKNPVTANVSKQIKSTTIMPSNRIESQVRFRNLHVAKPANIHLPPEQPLLLSHEIKLQEIMKRKDAMRSRVKGDPMKAINTMPIVNPLSVNRIFLITYFRSGSSFLGELLQQNWKTFYQFEPLHYMTYGSRISDRNRTEEAFELFSSIYHCNFTNLDYYFQWVRKPKNQFLFTRSLFLWFTCRSNPRMCFYPDFVSAVCKRAPVQVIKTTRLHMRHLKEFLDENPDLNIQVVYLTRDPRGIISSRTSLDWCNGTECSDPHVICSDMADDIRVFEELSNQEPSKFIRVRYEDLALNPEKEALRIFQFLNLSFSQSVRRFLKSHTTARKSDVLDPYSTRRNSSSMAFSWKARFNFEQVSTVQNSCADVINKLNYSMINNPNELVRPVNIVYKNISTNSKKLANKPKQVLSFQTVAKYNLKNVIDKHSQSSSDLIAENNVFPMGERNVTISPKTASNNKFMELKNLNNSLYNGFISKSSNFHSNDIKIERDVKR